MRKERGKITDNVPKPDEGWAWVVVIATMANTFQGVGMYRTFGIFIVELRDLYDAPDTEVSLIVTSVAIGFFFSALLYVLGLGDVVHERSLIAASGLMACVGFVVTFFSTKLEHVCVQGFCSGASMQICVASGLGIVGKYFDKRRALANGIVLSGVSLGAIVFPPIVQWLLDEYTFRGTALITAGVSLNSVVFGALMRPVKSERRAKSTKSANREPEQAPANFQTAPPIFSITRQNGTNHSSSPPTRSQTNGICLENGFFNRGYEDELVDTRPKEMNDRHSTPQMSETSSCAGAGNALPLKENRALHGTKPCSAKLPLLKSLVYGLSLFKSPSFIMVQLFILFSTAGSETLLLFYPSFTKDTGILEHQTATLLSVIGVGDLFSRLGFGFLGDSGLLERYKLAMIPQFILATACFLLRFGSGFWSQAFFAGVTGLTYGVTYALRAVVLVDFFGLPDLTRMLGIGNVIGSIGLMCGSQILGYVQGSTEGYLMTQQALGIIFLAAGFSLVASGLLKCRQQQKQGTYDITTENS